jgi:hypothetical protein
VTRTHGGRASHSITHDPRMVEQVLTLNDADLAGLTEEQAARCRQFHEDLTQTRDGIAVWHRLLDRRRLDRKLGLHPIAEFTAAEKPRGDAQGTLAKKPADEPAGVAQREPFYLRSESEARALLLRAVGYLSNAAGERLAFDKGAGERDKMAEWIAKEIKEQGAVAYIQRHSPYVFGIPLAIANT